MLTRLLDTIIKCRDRYSEFNRIKVLFEHLKVLDIGNLEQKASIIKISNQIINSGDDTRTEYKSSYTPPKTSSESSNSRWVIGIIIAVVLVGARFAKIFRNTGSSKSKTSTNYKIPRFRTTFDEEKMVFYSDLIHKASGDDIGSYKSGTLVTGRNPYPMQFKTSLLSTRQGQTITLKNAREHPLIVFQETDFKPSNNISVFLKKDDSLYLKGIQKNTKLIFYAGQDFVASYKNNGRGNFTNGNLGSTRKYFKSVSEVEMEWLKNKYIIDSIGKSPAIELIDDKLVFKNINYHIEKINVPA